jgi:excisionase family DNA binding protein
MSEWISVREVAHILGVHDRTIRKYIADGRLQSKKDGRRILVRSDSLSAFEVNRVEVTDMIDHIEDHSEIIQDMADHRQNHSEIIQDMADHRQNHSEIIQDMADHRQNHSEIIQDMADHIEDHSDDHIEIIQDTGGVEAKLLREQIDQQADEIQYLRDRVKELDEQRNAERERDQMIMMQLTRNLSDAQMALEAHTRPWWRRLQLGKGKDEKQSTTNE